MTMALEGIKILDLSRLAPGPYCSMLLSDFGADVTLVEAVPGSSAKLGGSANPNRDQRADRAAAYNALGRAKKSIALNLKDPEARDIFYRMAQDADVVLEGFRPGVVKRLGVDYETLKAINPRIIYCSLSGFGQTGPYSNLVGPDIKYIATGGALGVIGWPDTPPAIPINIIADFAGGGLYAAFGIAMALLARDRTGEGQYVDMGMSDGVMSLMTSAYSQLFASGNQVERGSSMLNGAVPWYNVYECKDGRWFSIGSIEGHFYEALCRVLGVEEYLDRQFDNSAYPEMKQKYTEIFRTKTADEWMALMSQHDICAATVLEMSAAVENEHNLARGMVVEVDSPVGPVRQIGPGVKLSETPAQVRGTAPLPGQHTDEILARLGFDDAAVAALRERSAIG
jgi:crotonobetainyl-CoA:carnitine CoA-transferase CaiB-like acyl-CoA transferase